VGQVADEKIPVGQKASVKCPVCGEKIILTRPVAAPDIIASGNAEKATPLSSVSPPKANDILADLRHAVADRTPNYDFTIGAILKEAWQKTSGVKGPIWGSAFMIFLLIILMGIGGRLLSTMLGGDEDNIALGAALQLTVMVAVYPFMAGVMMIGIRHSIGLPVNWKMALGYFSYLVPIVVAAVLITVLTFIGFMLIILPGIYLSLGYSLTMPLIIDKGMSPWQAMEASRQAIHKCWFKVFGLYFVMALIYLVSVIPFGLGLIWTVPMFVMVSAILYRELFGVNEKS
jgi:hypothetical protein